VVSDVTFPPFPAIISVEYYTMYIESLTHIVIV
jgi:hypothetical protein